GTAAVVRVVKGHLAAEELAALTAVLLARAANLRTVKGHSRPRARWHRLGLHSAYHSPLSWR
ncbi:acyl-CoA carboxylase epsilon subunit, partial [Streptacidiphilus sp. EB129]|uniref:acyl-CoA carboxylase epsilon subunit n=1 Tax=Streptacidiphilus sp. EB129 TaxID=3156262 RepID=UPI0035188BE7